MNLQMKALRMRQTHMANMVNCSSWTKHPPMSVEHSAEYLHTMAVNDAKENDLAINIRVEHVAQLIREAKVEPCFAVLRMRFPQNGWLLGNVTCHSLV